MDLVVFWIVAPISVGAAVLMLLQRNAVYAALFLVLNQFTLAVFFVLLDAHFLAAVQVIVYAGAIMVLFLFVIMFLGVDRREALVETIPGQRWLAIGLGLLLVSGVVLAIGLGVGLTASPGPAPAGDNVRAIARVLFTDYVLPFEITSILLIVAAVAAMVLARRKARGLPDPDTPAGDPAPEREPVS
ncbi:MAG: NADH-quinone oxidoreductase subunit J [Actinomycetota bacterium]